MEVKVITEGQSVVAVLETTKTITVTVPGGQGAPGISAYAIAKKNGFVGTELEWLDSLVGATGAGEKGDTGEKGDQGDVGATGSQGEQGIQGETGEAGEQGIQGVKGDQGDIGLTGAAGADGDDGREIELQKTITHVQWRYVGDVSWTNLIALVDIKGDTGAQGANGSQGIQGIQGETGATGETGSTGATGSAGADGNDGRETEIQNNGTYIQWRYVGDVAWTNIVALSALVGATGSTGATGSAGADGNDGRETEIQNNGTYIQWRYVGDVAWTNIVALSALVGATGATGAAGASGAAGADGVSGSKVVVPVDFGGSFTDKAQVVVTGQAWVTADSAITAEILTPDGVDPDEMYLLDIRAVISNRVAGVGFTVTLYSQTEATGVFSVMCLGV